ncbi:22263_t:CDS:2, partial [Gigaspora margarita]
DLVTRQVEKYVTENGFKIVKQRLQRNKRANICLSDGIIRVISMCKNHNYPLSNDIQNTEMKFHYLGSEMLEENEFLVNIGYSTGPIIQLIKTDAAKTYKRLMQLQYEEHGWFVKARLKGEDNHLTILFTDEDP